MSWACIMPEELSVVPRGLVCLANLNTRHHSVHRAIWELLDKERPNASLRYRLVDVDEQYPASKSKVCSLTDRCRVDTHLSFFIASNL